MKKLLPLLLLLLLSCKEKQERTPSQPSVNLDSLKAEQQRIADSIALREQFIADSLEQERQKEQWLADTVLYTSENPREKLLHVRVHSDRKAPTYLFLGAEVPQDSTDKSQLVRFYEYRAEAGIHVIDSAPMHCFDGEWIGTENGVVFEEFLYRNYDNLYIINDTLFYYTERGIPKRDETRNHSLKKFFAYTIKSKEKARSITAESYYKNNPRRTLNSAEVLSFSPSGEQLAYSDIYNVFFHKSKNYSKAAMYEAYVHKDILADTLYDTAAGDFELMPIFPDTLGFQDNGGCDARALFGGMHWYPNEKVLFFDNSGYCYACVWMIDLETRACTKLVPDHEAIHPYYFTRYGYEFLAYVQNNQIRKFALEGVL